MKKLLLAIAAFTLIYSCEKKQDLTEANTEVISDSTTLSEPLKTSESDEIASTNSAISGKPALNPAHGEPFHRCDILVGAPIDSAPEQNMAPPQMQQAVPTAPQSSLIPQDLGEKPTLNPAHGQPHHKCELAVGAPLV